MKIKHLFIFFLLLIQSNIYAVGVDDTDDDNPLDYDINWIDSLLDNNEKEEIFTALETTKKDEIFTTLEITQTEYDELLHKVFKKLRTNPKLLDFSNLTLTNLIKDQSLEAQIKTGRLKIVG